MIYSAQALAELLFGDLALSRTGLYYVAYSGGIDSTVLLHLMDQVSQQDDNDISVTAVYGLSIVPKYVKSWVCL